MPTRLAVTFSGAVSLGSYEAGVLYEVLDAIGQHNLSATSEDDKIYIDVMTGASAGGLSVALASQTLLYSGDQLSDPYNNPLYQAWVIDTDLDKMLAFAKDEGADLSILSSDYIDELASKYLLGRYKSTLVPTPKAHPSINPSAPTLKLGMALSNLNGIDYSKETLAGDEFIYSRFQDEFRQPLSATTDNQATWLPIKDAAVSCGAFPFAFRVKGLSRTRECYPSSDFDGSKWPADPHTFAFTDGGVFQNEPLGLAKDFVDEIDCHQNTESRAYLFCSPDSKDSCADLTFTAESANFFNMAKRLMTAIFDQARFQDWIQAETVNNQIKLFNDRALGLHKIVLEKTLDPITMLAVSTPLLAELRRLPEGDLDLVAARQQLRGQFSSEYDDLVTNVGAQAADAWIDGILVFELAADLHEKDEMYIYTVTASDQELAGGAVVAFLGFFEQEYRQHDYDIGRTKAQAFLKSQRSTGPLKAISYNPKPILHIIDSLANVPLKDVPVDKRKELADRLQNRLDILLKEANVNPVARKLLEFFYLNHKISALLEV